jgi:hypothetical protein
VEEWAVVTSEDEVAVWVVAAWAEVEVWAAVEVWEVAEVWEAVVWAETWVVVWEEEWGKCSI